MSTPCEVESCTGKYITNVLYYIKLRSRNNKITIEEYYEDIVVPINDFVTLRSNKYFPSGKYTNQVIGYTSHPETKKLSYIFENDEITEITKCISLNDKHVKI